MKKGIIITGIFLLALFAIAVKGETANNEVSTDTALARNLNTFNTITRYLAQAYVDSLRPDEAFKTAIGGLLYTVDPYTEYYDAEDVERLEVITTGAYGGIGAFVMQKGSDTYINLPIEGTPSYKAGLKSGDRIIMVDSIDMKGKTTDIVTGKLKGDPGTMVKVTVERPYETDSILTFDIQRERIQDKSVPFYGVIDGIGFIKLTSFMEKSAQEIRQALESFKANPEVKGVILDLRDNGGGLVGSAIDILGMFFPKDTKVIETRGKVSDANKTFTTLHSPLLPNIPLAVLIDEGSASASEITAGAIQDLDRGIIVGRRSFGKGLVQSTLSLPYNGVLKVTTAKYRLPSGRLIQALDYSHRNPDGSVARTPDSLTNEFLTKKGRIVRDGGGLIPDSVVEAHNYSKLVTNLILENQIFDYATRFAARHPSIPSPSEFHITDEIFDEFVEFVDTAKIKSDKSGEMILEQLRKTAKTEGFMTDELESSLDSIAPLLAPDLKRDLHNKRPEIEEFLGREIIRRYYNRSGEEEYLLRFDNEFEVARNILNNPELYGALLTPKTLKASPKKGK